MKKILKIIFLIPVLIFTACEVPTSKSASKHNSSSIESSIVNKKFVGFDSQKNSWLGIAFSTKDKILMFKIGNGNTKEKALEALANEQVLFPVHLQGKTFKISSQELVFISDDKLFLYVLNDRDQWTLVATLDKV